MPTETTLVVRARKFSPARQTIDDIAGPLWVLDVRNVHGRAVRADRRHGQRDPVPVTVEPGLWIEEWESLKLDEQAEVHFLDFYENVSALKTREGWVGTVIAPASPWVPYRRTAVVTNLAATKVHALEGACRWVEQDDLSHRPGVNGQYAWVPLGTSIDLCGVFWQPAYASGLVPVPLQSI